MYLGDEFCNPFDGNPENFWMKLEHCGRYLYAYDQIKKSDVIADIGCATGYGTYFLAQKARLVIGVDNKEIYLDYAKHNYHSSNIYYVPVDLETETETLANRNVTKIICFETLEHTRCPLDILSSFYKILPTKGEAIISFPNNVYEKFDENGKNYDPYHLSVVYLQEFLRHAQQLGFKIKHVLGQTLMNDVTAQTSFIQKKYHMSMDDLYQYDMESIIYFSRHYAYPDDFDVPHSYSFIVHLQK